MVEKVEKGIWVQSWIIYCKKLLWVYFTIYIFIYVIGFYPLLKTIEVNHYSQLFSINYTATQKKK